MSPRWAMHVIGVGAGDPRQLTLEAVDAINGLDLVLVLDKEGPAQGLSRAREALLNGCLRAPVPVVHLADPPRDRTADDYVGAVEAWRSARREVIAGALTEHLPEGGRVGILAWGDPCLYDGTIRIVRELQDAGHAIDLTVIPGITSVQTLCARHGIPLNRVAGSVHLTTGRRLRAGWPAEAKDVVVMLDSELAAAQYLGQGLTIYWGADLGTADEALVAGPLDDVVEQIRVERARIRERTGWVMDTYLLRRPD